MNRGAARATVFRDPEDAHDFLRLLGELRPRFGAEVHAYCVMGNHYHVLLRTPEPNLSDAMRHLDGVLTQRLHRRRETDGPIFRGRFRSVLVQADRHLLHVTRYIHLNPVEAGLARRPEDWPWSSYRGYLNPPEGPRWLRTRFVLAQFGTIGTHAKYREFVQAGLDPGTRGFYGGERIPPVLGDAGFRERVREQLRGVPEGALREFPDARDITLRRPLAAIAEGIAGSFDVPLSRLRVHPGRPTSEETVARGAFVHAARVFGGWRLREVASWLGYVSYTGAAEAASRFATAAARDPSLVERLEGVKSSLTVDPGDQDVR
jgi:REP element-mobilizing transposase RayT